MKAKYLICISLFFCHGIIHAQERTQNNFEDWSSKPAKVIPGGRGVAPSDAVILFSEDLKSWNTVSGEDVTWPASVDGFAVVPGTESIQTRQAFGSCQLHVEWRVPTNEDRGETLDWGNSGVYLMGFYEVQIYDSYNDAHKIYYNGQAGSIYKQHKPLGKLLSQAPGEWESFDIVFAAPEFNEDGYPKKSCIFHSAPKWYSHPKPCGGARAHQSF